MNGKTVSTPENFLQIKWHVMCKQLHQKDAKNENLSHEK